MGRIERQSKENMIEINITPEQVERAKVHFEFGKLKNSLRQGEGNLLGAIGEIVAFDYYIDKVKSIIHDKKYSHDLLINNFKVEVKTMEVNVKPKSFHQCNVSCHNSEQDCDYYLFVNVNSSHTTAFINGFISKRKYIKLRKFKKQGEKNGSFQYKYDTFTILNNQLS